MRFKHRASQCGLVLVVMLVHIGGCVGRTLFQAEPSSSGGSSPNTAGSSNNTSSIPDFTNESVGEIVGKQLVTLLKQLPLQNLTIPKNFTLPKLEIPKHISLQNVTADIKKFMENITIDDGVSMLEFSKRLMTGTISSNTADTNTPDKGLSDVQSGALNINPFIDGASMSNALTLAGRDATANSRGIVFGLTGTGRSSNEATALGITGAKSSTDTFVINGGGVNQNAMGSNLAIAPQGPSDTSVRSAAFNIIGSITTGGLTNAIGKKGGSSAGLGASMTGLGDSYSSQFANSLSEGATSSNTGVIAGTLTGASKGTVGSVATSAKRSAATEALSTSKSGIGSSTSKSASMSTAAQNASSHSGSNSFSGIGNTASISTTAAQGLNAAATADSTAKSQAGAASSIAVSEAKGVTSGSSASNATSRPSMKGIKNAPILWMQLKLPSVTFTSSKSSSNSLQENTSPTGFLPGLLPHLPQLPFGRHKKPSAAIPMPNILPTTSAALSILGEALASTVGLKALLPSVPKIVPQLPTLNQTVQVNNTASPCNETLINANRTANETRLRCNETNSTSPAPQADQFAGLPGLSFFDNLKDMNHKFIEENNKNGSNAAAKGTSSKSEEEINKATSSKPSSKETWSAANGGRGGGGSGGTAAAAGVGVLGVQKATGSSGSGGSSRSANSSGSSAGKPAIAGAVRASPKPAR